MHKTTTETLQYLYETYQSRTLNSYNLGYVLGALHVLRDLEDWNRELEELIGNFVDIDQKEPIDFHKLSTLFEEFKKWPSRLI